jgi:hypothetical protein
MKIKLLLILATSLLALKYIKAQTLHIYGGRNHDVYLGCLNCNNYDQNSIWNEYGKYGSKYYTNCIWNSYGTYGSEYNPYSPWNSYSSSPPVVVDREGNFYGYFTINEYKSNRADFNLALIIYKYHSSIRNNVTGWYDKIFE